jgi:hypothetical protein
MVSTIPRLALRSAFGVRQRGSVNARPHSQCATKRAKALWSASIRNKYIVDRTPEGADSAIFTNLAPDKAARSGKIPFLSFFIHTTIMMPKANVFRALIRKDQNH